MRYYVSNFKFKEQINPELRCSFKENSKTLKCSIENVKKFLNVHESTANVLEVISDNNGRYYLLNDKYKAFIECKSEDSLKCIHLPSNTI